MNGQGSNARPPRAMTVAGPLGFGKNHVVREGVTMILVGCQQVLAWPEVLDNAGAALPGVHLSGYGIGEHWLEIAEIEEIVNALLTVAESARRIAGGAG